MSNAEIEGFIREINEAVTAAQEIQILVFSTETCTSQNIPKETAELCNVRRRIKKAIQREKVKVKSDAGKIQEMKSSRDSTSSRIETETRSFLREKFETQVIGIATHSSSFRIVNRLTGRKRRPPTAALLVNGQRTSNPEKIAEEFVSFYSGLYEARPPPTALLVRRYG